MTQIVKKNTFSTFPLLSTVHRFFFFYYFICLTLKPRALCHINSGYAHVIVPCYPNFQYTRSGFFFCVGVFVFCGLWNKLGKRVNRIWSNMSVECGYVDILTSVRDRNLIMKILNWNLEWIWPEVESMFKQTTIDYRSHALVRYTKKT